jgi:hypothetical protein
MLNVLFHAFNLGHRGGTNSLRDYAIYNETILGNRSTILYHTEGHQRSEPDVIESLSKRFELIPVSTNREVDALVKPFDVVYSQRSGYDEEPSIRSAPFLLHGVFCNYTDQCTRFAYISKYLSERMRPEVPYIPYMIDLPQPNDNLRKELNISEDQFVFGRMGGWLEFDIPFVKQTIQKILSHRSDIVFVFVNTQPFIEHKNVFYLPPSFDQQFKSNFINTCDAMIHAREMGETFGLAMMEFLYFNKPVLAWESGNDLNHVDVLKPFNLLYNSDNIEQKIYDLVDKKSYDFSSVVAEYTPANVMKKFNGVFLHGIK